MTRELLTPGQRVRWAIDHSQRTMQDIGAEIGCTHSALSQWANDHTNVENVKAALLTAFARATGVNVEWLLTGDGPAIVEYRRTESALVKFSRHIAQERPALEDTALRILQALDQQAPPAEPDAKG